MGSTEFRHGIKLFRLYPVPPSSNDNGLVGMQQAGKETGESVVVLVTSWSPDVHSSE